MKKRFRLFLLCCALFSVLSLTSCNPLDQDYGTHSEPSETDGTSTSSSSAAESIPQPEIMSLDRVMSQFVDISLYDEENYSAVYLGKRFKFQVRYVGDDFSLPTKIATLAKSGWTLSDKNEYDEESSIFAGESINAVFEREDGKTITATFYNSANNSVKLKKCNIVKFRIENDFYTDPGNFSEFNVNGLTNRMAVTDIIDTLGMPSHFYSISKDEYYLDYFITEKDKRNGITVYINTTDDAVTAVEFSYYK